MTSQSDAPRDRERHSPVFVLSPARSYSSVVTTMIGMHPELYGFPELSLFRAPLVRGLIANPPSYRGLPVPARTAGLARALAELHEHSQSDDAVQRARAWLAARPDWPTALVFDHMLDQVAPATGVEKSPENSSRDDFLVRLIESYPKARFVHLTRHPVTTVRSMAKAWSNLGFWDVPEDLFHFHVLGIWLFTHARIKRFTSALPPDRSFRVRAEDLLSAPQGVLPALCQWLEVDDGDAAIESMLHPERSPFARLGPPGGLGGNDPGFLEAPAIRPATAPDAIEIPSDWKVDPWFLLSVVEFATSIGYGRYVGSKRTADERNDASETRQ